MQLGSGVGAGSFPGKMLLFLLPGACLAELGELREAALLVVTATLRAVWPKLPVPSLLPLPTVNLPQTGKVLG